MRTLLCSLCSLALAALTSSGCTFDGLGQSVSAGDAGHTATDAERVFSVSRTTSNAGEITGIWESAQSETKGDLTSTSRFEFRQTFVIAAARCTLPDETPVVVGGRASATVTAAVIQIDEAVSDTAMVGGTAACGVRASAGVLPTCGSAAPAERTTCFDLSGGGLTLYQNGAAITFVKIAD